MLPCRNGLFVLGRSIGFIAHHLDQKRLKQPLYRHPAEYVLVVVVAACSFPGPLADSGLSHSQRHLHPALQHRPHPRPAAPVSRRKVDVGRLSCLESHQPPLVVLSPRLDLSFLARVVSRRSSFRPLSRALFLPGSTFSSSHGSSCIPSFRFSKPHPPLFRSSQGAERAAKRLLAGES